MTLYEVNQVALISPDNIDRAPVPVPESIVDWHFNPDLDDNKNLIRSTCCISNSHLYPERFSGSV